MEAEPEVYDFRVTATSSKREGGLPLSRNTFLTCASILQFREWFPYCFEKQGAGLWPWEQTVASIPFPESGLGAPQSLRCLYTN